MPKIKARGWEDGSKSPKCPNCHCIPMHTYQYEYETPGKFWQFYYCPDCGHNWDNYDPSVDRPEEWWKTDDPLSFLDEMSAEE